MSRIADLLAANRTAAPPAVTEVQPARRLAVVTCMDVRIDVSVALGLALGDAHIIRNAGGRVTDDVLRSLALSSGVLGVDAVVLMQHTKCGLAGASDAELRGHTGADVDFLPIADHATSLRQDVELIVATPYLAHLQTVAGFLYDVDTGRVEEVVRRDRTA